MIITFLWSVISHVVDGLASAMVGLLGSPPEWWPTGDYDAFTGGVSYLVYFFNITACAAIVTVSLAFELAVLAARWMGRSVSFFTGGGGSF